MKRLPIGAAVGIAALAIVLVGIPSLRAADLPEGLQIFGHLTQAYGESSLGSIRGTSEDGSTDLRKIAIQFRWEKSETDLVVIQLSHEKIGNDIFQPTEKELEGG